VATSRRAAYTFIFITILLDSLAFGMIIPVLPKLVESFMGGDAGKAAQIYGLFGTIWALMQLISMPIIGALSDRYGRRPVILASVAGLGVDSMLMALAPTVWWLLVGRVVSGITAANVSTASAYIADTTPPDRRAQGFGMMGAAFGLGFILGPVVGGLLGADNPRLPFWIASGFCMLNALYGLFVLPESLPPERRARFEWGKANPVGALKMLAERPELRGLALTKFLMDISHVVLPSTFVLYAGYRYGWGVKQVGVALFAVGLCSMAVQGALVGPVVKRLGERKTLPLGLIFGALGFLGYGLAPTSTIMLAMVPLQALWGFAGPALQGLATRRVSGTEQGRLQGAFSTTQSIAQIIGPALYTQAFAWFISDAAPVHLPGAPFLIAACFLVLSLVLGLTHTRAAALPTGTG